MSRSYLLRGGTLFSGASPQRRTKSDLRIVDGAVAEIGTRLRSDSSVIIDVDEMWVMPGFIDAHSHVDASALTGEGMESRAMAGVTTEIVGQDGLGLSFASGNAYEAMADILEPLLGSLPDRQFHNVGTYLDAMDQGAFARVATLVPHGAVRATVMGRDLRDADMAERRQMRRLIHDGIEEGGLGLSTGLSYPPALASTTDELIDVTSGLPKGTPYVTHLRDYGAGLDRSLIEAFDICSQSGLSLHLSHFHVSGPGREGHAGLYLDRFRAAELPVSWDTYPYTAGCTFIGTLLPASVQSHSTRDLLLSIQNSGHAAKLAREIDSLGPGPTIACGWDGIHLAGLKLTGLRHWESRTIADIAGETGATNGSIVLKVISETNGNACVLVNQGHEENVRAIANEPQHLVGSDGIMGAGMPHPRTTNTFFRFLDWANRGVLNVSVEEMVARMTARTAKRFGLNTGTLAVGRPADVLVVDRKELEEGPSLGMYAPRALRHSFIRGERVVNDGSWLAPRLAGLTMRRGYSA